MSDETLPSNWIVLLRLLGAYIVGVLIASFLTSLPGAGELFPLYFIAGLAVGAPIFLIIALFVVIFKGPVHRHPTVAASIAVVVTTVLLMSLHYMLTFAGHMPVAEYLTQLAAITMAAAALIGSGIAAYTFIRVSKPRGR